MPTNRTRRTRKQRIMKVSEAVFQFLCGEFDDEKATDEEGWEILSIELDREKQRAALRLCRDEVFKYLKKKKNLKQIKKMKALLTGLGGAEFKK